MHEIQVLEHVKVFKHTFTVAHLHIVVSPVWNIRDAMFLQGSEIIKIIKIVFVGTCIYI